MTFMVRLLLLLNSIYIAIFVSYAAEGIYSLPLPCAPLPSSRIEPTRRLHGPQWDRGRSTVDCCRRMAGLSTAGGRRWLWMTLAIIPVPILLFWMPGQLIQLIVFTGTTEAMMNAETIRAVQVARARPRARPRAPPPRPTARFMCRG
jgi:hypothetical protein